MLYILNEYNDQQLIRDMFLKFYLYYKMTYNLMAFNFYVLLYFI